MDDAHTSHCHVDEVYDTLGSFSWSVNISGFSHAEPKYKLTMYMTQRWLSDMHKNQMFDLLHTEIQFAPMASQPVIQGTEFSTHLHKVYEQ